MTVPVRRARPGKMSGLDRCVAALAMTGGSAEDLADDAGGFDAGEALVEALRFEGELRVVDPKAVQQRRVEVV